MKAFDENRLSVWKDIQRSDKLFWDDFATLSLLLQFLEDETGALKRLQKRKIARDV